MQMVFKDSWGLFYTTFKLETGNHLILIGEL